MEVSSYEYDINMRNASSDKRPVCLTLTGDFFCSSQFDQNELASISNYLSSKSNPIVNFEGSFESDFVTKKSIRLASDPSTLNILDDCTLSLANNHVLDFGTKGLALLLSKFQKRSIQYFGINSNDTTVDNFKVFNFDGVRVCLIGFGAKNEECLEPNSDAPGILDFNSKNLTTSFEALGSVEYDYLFVYAHIGYEFEKYPLPLHVGLCRKAIDLGADLVYCSHTHCLQPYELYQDKYIFYGLGNFYFSNNRDRYPSISDVGAMVSVVLARKNREIKILNVEKVTYSRPPPGLKIEPFDEYLEMWELKAGALKVYSRDYPKKRTRKKNPRPILYYETPVSNFLKYITWKLAVDITGVLGIRKVVKRFLKWQ